MPIGTKIVGSFTRMDFLNGSINLPNQYGGYVISSGCGSGKTTVIRSMIHEHFAEGILYSAGTIRECDEMYNWLMNNAVGKPNSHGLIMKKEDIIVLHSKNNDSMYEYLVDPEGTLPNIKVLICTHYKVLHDDPSILTNQNFYGYPVGRRGMTHCRRAVTTQGGRPPRQWIFIDEIPSCDPLKVYFSRVVKAALHKEFDNSTSHYDDEMKLYVSDTIDIKLGPNTLDEMMIRYNTLVEGSRVDPFLEDFKNQSFINRPRELRKELILESFWHNEIEPLKSPVDPSMIADGYVIHNISDFIESTMSTRVIVFEGTGDLTFGLDNDSFLVIDLPRKYNSFCKTIRIDKLLSKRSLKNSWINGHYDKLNNEVVDCCTSLKDIINENYKTLIVTWKNFKVDMNDKGSDEGEVTISGVTYNKNLVLPSCITKTLISMGVPQDKFSVIHYKSGLDKATNEFRDYDSIVFLGEFHVPFSVVEEFNQTYHSKCSPFRFSLYQLAQAVCRTRIRNHQNEPVNIYMTSDWDINTMVGLNYYFNKDVTRPTADPNVSLSIDSIERAELTELPKSVEFTNRAVNEVFGSKKWITVSKKIDSGLIPGFMNTIMDNLSSSTPVTLRYEVDLDDIHKVYPMENKEVRRYDPFVRFLKKLNTELVVTSYRSK